MTEKQTSYNLPLHTDNSWQSRII